MAPVVSVAWAWMLANDSKAASVAQTMGRSDG